MDIPLLDLTRQYAEIGPELLAAAKAVLESGRYILGPEVEAFEAEIADYIGIEHAVGMSSGTDAILAALMALGISPGDEVIVPSYTFFATAGSVARLGARPVFVDVDDDSLMLTPEAVAEVLTEKTKAVIAVHLFGRAADIPALRAVCDPERIPVVEDAAQAIGTRLDGVMVGGLGAIATYSFFPSKNLGALGDGGLCTTNDPALAQRLAVLRNHGQTGAYEHELIGGNFRLDALQAAMLRVKLRHLEDWTAARRDNAARWRALFADHTDLVRCPTDVEDRHAYHQYVVRVPAERRDHAVKSLRAAGLGCAVYYACPLHLQPCFVDSRPSLPVAEAASREALAVPIFPELREDEQDRFAHALIATLTDGS